MPLAAKVTGANRHDVTQLIPLIDAIPPIRGKVGAPLRKPKEAAADRAYDSDPHREELADRRISSKLARRKTPHGSGLGTVRWVVERTISWLHQARRLKVKYERRADTHEAFVKLRMSVICWSLWLGRFGRLC